MTSMRYWKGLYLQDLEEAIFRFVVGEKIQFLIVIFRNLCAYIWETCGIYSSAGSPWS
jgi:hypothetical protein